MRPVCPSSSRSTKYGTRYGVATGSASFTRVLTRDSVRLHVVHQMAYLGDEERERVSNMKSDIVFSSWKTNPTPATISSGSTQSFELQMSNAIEQIMWGVAKKSDGDDGAHRQSPGQSMAATTFSVIHTLRQENPHFNRDGPGAS